MSNTIERRAALPSLTSLRAIAALMVFAHHLPGVLFPGQISGYGYVGVTFFYVLSGFVLTWSATSSGGLGRFYTRRFFRIYPSHFVVTASLLAVASILVGIKHPKVDLAQVLLLQAWSPDWAMVWGLNGVTWSLSCEFFFYLVFPLIVQGAARLSTTLFLWIAGALLAAEAVFAVYASHFALLSPIWMVGGANPLVRLPEFVLGIALARFAIAGRSLHWAVGVSVATICIAGFILVPARPAPDVWFAPLMGLVILFFARQDALGRRLLGSRPLVYAGEVSFAFYLVHQLVINNVVPRLGIGWPQAGVAFVIAVPAALALHHVVEKPAFRFFTKNADALMSRRRTIVVPVQA